MIRIWDKVPEKFIQKDQWCTIEAGQENNCKVLSFKNMGAKHEDIPISRYYDVEINSAQYFWLIKKLGVLEESFVLTGKNGVSFDRLLKMSDQVYCAFDKENKRLQVPIKCAIPNYESIDWIRPNGSTKHWTALIENQGQLDCVPLFALSLMQNTVLQGLKQANASLKKVDLIQCGLNSPDFLRGSELYDEELMPIFKPPKFSSLSDSESKFVLQWSSLLQMIRDDNDKEKSDDDLALYIGKVFNSEYCKSPILEDYWKQILIGKGKLRYKMGVSNFFESIDALLGLFSYCATEYSKFEADLLDIQISAKKSYRRTRIL